MLVGGLVAFANPLVTMPSRFGSPRPIFLTTLLFRTQDAAVLVGCAVVLLAFSISRIPSPPRVLVALLRGGNVRVLVGLATLTLLVTFAGTFLVFGNFPLSRDEVLAGFDSLVLRSGKLLAPLPAEWQPFAASLNPDFMLPIAGYTGWVSSYLPVNASLRAFVGLICDPALANPLLASVSVLALAGAARRLWPQRPDATFVSVLLLVTSSQFLVTAMTAYAMTAHLALNLVWLWLYLRGDRLSHAGAICVGFLATGLHQLLFHPLFVTPFILRSWRMRQRSLAFSYAVSYAVICLFWMNYGKLVLDVSGATAGVTSGAGLSFFLARAASLVSDFSFSGLLLMLENLLRFVAWQNLLAVPLAVAAWSAMRQKDSLAQAIAEGIVVTFVAMLVILPYQGHGWGYRYWHGLLGSLCLLSGYGWIAVTSRAAPAASAAARGAVVVATLAAGPVFIAQCAEAHAWVAPYRRAADAMRDASAPIVLVDRTGLLFAADLVRNDPYLRNSPKLLDLANLDEHLLEDICRRYDIAIFDEHLGRALGVPAYELTGPMELERLAQLRAYMTKLSCGTLLGTDPGRSAGS
jgi:hypothetical protein